MTRRCTCCGGTMKLRTETLTRRTELGTQCISRDIKKCEECESVEIVREQAVLTEVAAA